MITNAGIGSNLTLDGTVEADASIMLGDQTFAAIGAAPGPCSADECPRTCFYQNMLLHVCLSWKVVPCTELSIFATSHLWPSLANP